MYERPTIDVDLNYYDRLLSTTMGVKQIFRYCDDCSKVVRTDVPECVHYGAYKLQKNTESVTVVFRSKDGRVSIPWEPNAKCPTGYVREEVRGSRAVRRLERELDAKDLQRHRESQLRMEAMKAPQLHYHRERLKQIAREHPHQFGRDLAKAALSRSERGYSSNYDAGNHRS